MANTNGGIFIGEPVEATRDLLGSSLEYDYKITDLTPGKSEWDGHVEKYKEYKLAYKKMEKTQNQLTALINSLLVGLQYYVESSENVLSIFSSLENFNEDNVKSLMGSLSDQSSSVLDLQRKVDNLVHYMTTTIETIDGYKKEIFDTLKDEEDAVEEGYEVYEFLYSSTFDKGLATNGYETGEKTYYYYNHYIQRFSIAEE